MSLNIQVQHTDLLQLVHKAHGISSTFIISSMKTSGKYLVDDPVIAWTT